MDGDGYIRIGELSRRTGISPELLRAWERRYGLFDPDRSPGRFRLYSDADVARVQAMQQHLARGLSAAEAARLVLAAPSDVTAAPARAEPVLDEAMHGLHTALATFDDSGAHAALDRLLASLSLDAFLQEVVLPVLRDLGERWARGSLTVGQEHFVSNLLRGRLLALGRGWGRGSGPHALLAAPAGEQHDLGLVVLALGLRDRGWRVTFLGADTPVVTIADTARRTSPEVIVLAMLMAPRSRGVLDEIRELARDSRLLLAGAALDPGLVGDLGAEYFPEGPVEAAEHLVESVAARFS